MDAYRRRRSQSRGWPPPRRAACAPVEALGSQAPGSSRPVSRSRSARGSARLAPPARGPGRMRSTLQMLRAGGGGRRGGGGGGGGGRRLLVPSPPQKKLKNRPPPRPPMKTPETPLLG